LPAGCRRYPAIRHENGYREIHCRHQRNAMANAIALPARVRHESVLESSRRFQVTFGYTFPR
jgi:hypothetical protein